MQYSITQATNLASLAGTIALILSLMKINIASEEIQTVIGAVLALYGIGSNWYHRYKKGDLTLGGFKKS